MQTSRQSERQEIGERAASQVHVMLQQYNAHFSCVCIPSKRAREPELTLAQGTTIANYGWDCSQVVGKSLIKCNISFQHNKSTPLHVSGSVVLARIVLQVGFMKFEWSKIFNT